jgi:hypothetical protein
MSVGEAPVEVAWGHLSEGGRWFALGHDEGSSSMRARALWGRRTSPCNGPGAHRCVHAKATPRPTRIRPVAARRARSVTGRRKSGWAKVITDPYRRNQK